MTTLVRTIQIDSVSPGPFGGAFVKGMPVGERDPLRCKIDYKVSIRIPREGEFWKVEGRLMDHPTYGPQLIVSSCRPVNLPTATYVTSLLANHPAFSGFYLGPKKIVKLTKEFSEEDLVEILNEGNIGRLTRVLRTPLARSLVNAWKSLESEIETINFLLDHKFSLKLAYKVTHMCRENVIKRLIANPYALVCFGGLTKNIWRTIELCARRFGLSLDHEGRLVGAVGHVFYEHLRDGSTAMYKSDLLSRAEKLLGTKVRAEAGLRMALKNKVICVYPSHSEPLFQLTGVGIMEQSLERRIDKLISAHRPLSLFSGDDRRMRVLVESYSDRSKHGGGHEFNDEQKSAVVMGHTNRISIIDGDGGTGKTTVLKAVADISKIIGRPVYLLALAGKAKERLRHITGHESFTIHKFISAVRRGAENISLNDDPLIVVDEASMVGTALFNELLGLFEGKAYSLLTVGDVAQISPVGFGLVWHRLVKISAIPITRLVTVYRQQSALHDVARKVRADFNGVMQDIPDWNGEIEGVFFVREDELPLREKLFKVKLDVDKKLRDQFQMRFKGNLDKVSLETKLKDADDAGDIPKAIILTPHMSERMPDSGAKINRYLQKCFTPLANAVQLGDLWLRVRDPVIVTESNYPLCLFNGMTGALLSIGQQNGQVGGLFRFDGHEKHCWLSIKEMLDVGIRLAYALSVHKSQGSEYDAVIFCCAQSSPMLEKSLAYTALTRAKSLCLIVGSREIFRKAISSPSRADKLEVGFFLSITASAACV